MDLWNGWWTLTLPVRFYIIIHLPRRLLMKSAHVSGTVIVAWCVEPCIFIYELWEYIPFRFHKIFRYSDFVLFKTVVCNIRKVRQFRSMLYYVPCTIFTIIPAIQIPFEINAEHEYMHMSPPLIEPATPLCLTNNSTTFANFG